MGIIISIAPALVQSTNCKSLSGIQEFSTELQLLNAGHILSYRAIRHCTEGLAQNRRTARGAAPVGREEHAVCPTPAHAAKQGLHAGDRRLMRVFRMHNMPVARRRICQRLCQPRLQLLIHTLWPQLKEILITLHWAPNLQACSGPLLDGAIAVIYLSRSPCCMHAVCVAPAVVTVSSQHHKT